MLSHNPLEPVYAQARTSAPQASSSGGVPALRWVDIPGGLHTIGHEGSGFCFDHEGPRHQTLLQNARIASRLVTNGEYLEFMRDGAYQRFDLWLSEGWRTVREQGWCAPSTGWSAKANGGSSPSGACAPWIPPSPSVT